MKEELKDFGWFLLDLAWEVAAPILAVVGIVVGLVFGVTLLWYWAEWWAVVPACAVLGVSALYGLFRFVDG